MMQKHFFSFSVTTMPFFEKVLPVTNTHFLKICVKWKDAEPFPHSVIDISVLSPND